MKKPIYLLLFLTAIMIIACKDSGQHPQLGDYVLFDYIIKQGDSVVYDAFKMREDTAQAIVEKPTSSTNEFQKELMNRLNNLSAGESSQFSLSNNQKGYIKLHRIIAQKDFAQYIESSNKEQVAFESRLLDIRNYLKSSIRFYDNRSKNVRDSVAQLAKAYKMGNLSTQLKTLPSGLKYIILEHGTGDMPRNKRAWVWMHFSGVLPDGTFLAETFKGGKIQTINQSEHNLMSGLEIVATQFKAGSKVLIVIPPSLAYGSEGMGSVPPNSELIFIIEIVNVNNWND